MVSPRASYLVAVVAACAALCEPASAGTTTAVAPVTRCEPAIASAADAARDSFVIAPDRCAAPAEEPRGAWHAEVRLYDGTAATAGAEPRNGREGYFGPIAVFAHFFRAFDAAAAHHLLPRFVRRRRVAAAPQDSIPSF